MAVRRGVLRAPETTGKFLDSDDFISPPAGPFGPPCAEWPTISAEIGKIPVIRRFDRFEPLIYNPVS